VSHDDSPRPCRRDPLSFDAEDALNRDPLLLTRRPTPTD